MVNKAINRNLELGTEMEMRNALNQSQPHLADRVRSAVIGGASPDHSPLGSPGQSTRPLEWLVCKREVDAVGVLLVAGANPDIEGGFGQADVTPRRIAEGMARDAVNYPLIAGSEKSLEIAKLFTPKGLAAWSAKQTWMPAFKEAMQMPRARRMELAFGADTAPAQTTRAPKPSGRSL